MGKYGITQRLIEYKFYLIFTWILTSPRCLCIPQTSVALFWFKSTQCQEQET